jgi:N-acetylmuramoyl-L-alanine amidase
MSNIKLILLSTLVVISITALPKKNRQNITIMLNPDGDAKNAGRMLQDSFERGVTLQFCTKLKRELENNCNNLRIVLTRFPGETIEYLQNANFSNRLNADIYLSIHFYKETEVLPNLYIYYFLNESFFNKNPISLHFYPFDKAHLLNIQNTTLYAQRLREFLSKNKNFETKKEIGIPFKPLIGIVAPSIAIEAGIKNYNSLDAYLIPISQAICQIFQIDKK